MKKQNKFWKDKMKILILYGQHTEERDICKKIAEEYIRRHNPDPELAEVRALKHYVSNSRPIRENVPAYEEISDLIETCKPQIVINLHHSFGCPWPFMSRRIETIFCHKGNDNLFFDYLGRQKDIAEVKYREPRPIDPFFAMGNTASENSCALLATELYLSGEGLKFPDNRTNKAAKNRLIELLARVQKYTEYRR
jgi:hypothetical protein